MSIIWDEKYSVGVDIIDQQHKQFVFIMDKLSKAIEEGKVKEVVDHILLELEEYVTYHFGTEEAYFKKFNYEGTLEHVEVHKLFGEKLSDIKDKYKRNEIRMSLELVSLMYDWLTDHIETLDRKYIDCFRQNGLI